MMFWNKTKTLVHLFKNFEKSFREEFRNHLAFSVHLGKPIETFVVFDLFINNFNHNCRPYSLHILIIIIIKTGEHVAF